MHTATGQLKVVPDNTTSGSEGRLCLQLPDEMAYLKGKQFTTMGVFSRDRCVVLLPFKGLATIRHGSVTDNLRFWWKNGVRDHGIRESYDVTLYRVDSGELIIILKHQVAGFVPKLPPHQETLF